jgi:hypothetical protein
MPLLLDEAVIESLIAKGKLVQDSQDLFTATVNKGVVYEGKIAITREVNGNLVKWYGERPWGLLIEKSQAPSLWLLLRRLGMEVRMVPKSEESFKE